jgi:hypothetical protein
MDCVYNKSLTFYRAIKDKIQDEDIVVTLDGDDKLLHNDVLKRLDEIYQDENVWFTYGNFQCNVPFRPYGRHIDWITPVRRQPFSFAHIRTYKWFLLKNVRDEDLKYGDGHFFRSPEDWVFCYPICEMAGPKHTRFIDEPLYFYRVHEGYHMNKQARMSDEVRMIIFNRPAYPRMTKEELIKEECDWND